MCNLWVAITRRDGDFKSANTQEVKVEESIAIETFHQWQVPISSLHPVVQTKKRDEMLKFERERKVDKPDQMSAPHWSFPFTLTLHLSLTEILSRRRHSELSAPLCHTAETPASF